LLTKKKAIIKLNRLWLQTDNEKQKVKKKSSKGRAGGQVCIIKAPSTISSSLLPTMQDK